MHKKRTLLLQSLLALSMSASVLSSAAPVFATENDVSLQEDTSSVTETTIMHSSFTFSEGNWENGENEHKWSKNLDADNPSATWCEVSFTGEEIDVYAGKNRPIGIVEYFVDGVSKGEYDLYNNGNVSSAKITTISDLGPGTHTFKAVATGKKNSAASNTLIDISKLVVRSTQSGDQQLIEETIPFTKTEGTTNKFTYSSSGWTAGNANHTWSETPGSNPSQIWYQVDFVGSEIAVYAGKNQPMGLVEYFIDGVSQGTFDLYNSSNIDSTLITTFSNLSEGPHTFKAVATGQKNSSATNSLIDCASVVIKHAPYTLNALSSSQDRYDLFVGAQQQLSIQAVPDYASAGTLSYSSSSPETISVSSTGLITANKEGSATITVTSDALPSAPLNITVRATEAQAELSGSIIDTNRQYTQDKYDSLQSAGTLNKTLSAWKNDTAVSQLVLLSKDAPLVDLSISSSSFTDNSGHTIPADSVKLDFIKSTKAYNGGYLGYGDPNRTLPADNGTNRSESSDILNGADPINLQARRVQPVWVSIKVPKDTPAGTYTGTIQANADNLDTPITFTYTLKVQDAVLPDATEFKNSFDIELWQYPYSSAEYYGVTPFSAEHLELMRSSMEIYKEIGGHAITTTCSEEAWNGQTYSENEIHYPSMIKWTKESDGSMSYDYTDFDKWVSFCKDMGLGDKIVVYSVAPWHGSFTYWDNGELVYESYSAGNARYNEVWTDFLNDLGRHLVEKGWFDDTYLGIDERGFSAAAFDMIDSVQIPDGQYTLTFKTAGSMDGFTAAAKFQLALRVTDLNVGDNAAAAHPAEFANLIEQREAKGLRTTLYSCTEHYPGNFSLSNPVESYWSAINASELTAGFNRWAYDAWVADPLNDATHNAFEPGDTFLIYPDEKDAENKASKYSLRLARMAEGVRDANKLRLMQSEIPGLEADIKALYDSISTTASTRRAYPDAAMINTMSDEMDAFKAGIDTLTEKYIEKKSTGVAEIESVEITAEKTEIAMGESLTLSALVSPDTVLDNRVTWSSSDPSIVSIDTDGTITGVLVGSAVITATSRADASKKDSITIRVSAPSIDASKQYASYPFEENLEDAWGSRDGSPIAESGIRYTEGYSGKGIHLDANSGVSFAKSSIGNNDPWTITYWVKADSVTGKSLITQDSTETMATAIKMADGRSAGFRVGTGNGDVLTFAYDFASNVWYHVAFTQSKTNGLKMYVNGELVNTNTWTINNTTICPADILGKSDFTGTVDDLKIYNAELSAAEIATDRLVTGLNLSVTSKTMDPDTDWQIPAFLVGIDESTPITYESLDPSIASVSKDGLVTAKRIGSTTIRVSAANSTKTIELTVSRSDLSITKTIPYYDLDQKYVTDVHKAPEDASGQYFGQPDMVRTKTGRLITAFPTGHGCGPLIMKYSDDDGETWIQKTDIPSSWANSMETPTLYVLNLADGTERLMLITGMPNWNGNQNGGWRTSYSDDNGETWTEYQLFNAKKDDGSNFWTIVAMASLIQLKDENGNDIQAWMGVFHDYGYVNYKSILTFDENGNEQWSKPVPYLSDYRSIESSRQMCEVGLFRSPDGKRIVGLARTQAHNNYATMFYSDDEGETWSRPIDLPGNLAGERHRAVYDPETGRLIITYRDIVYDRDGDGIFAGGGDWICGEWVIWVGTYEDLMNQKDGDYMVNIAYDWSMNTFSGDTGYAGILVLDDGTIMMDSYGHWDREYSEAHGSNVRTDRCYIKFAKFKLSDIEKENGIPDRSKLRAYIADNKLDDLDLNLYTEETGDPFKDALRAAHRALDLTSSSQSDLDAAYETLKAAHIALAGIENPDLYTELYRKAIEKGRSLDLDAFKNGDAKDSLQAALNKSANILANAATQSEIDTAALELNRCLLAMRKTPAADAIPE